MSAHFTPAVKLVLGLILVFTLLGLADLFLTWKLIQRGDGQVLESNPVAGWWLDTFGWGGMAAFKVGMILVVGGLAGGIAWVRPRTSELILVFACGAQSAVVLHSVFLTQLVDEQAANPMAGVYWPSSDSPEPEPRTDPPRWQGPGFLPENGLMLLLTRGSVQQELRLSEAQVSEVVRLAGRRRELRMGSRGSSREEWGVLVQQLLAQEKALTEDLGPEQAQRLQQLAWQQRGPLAFTDPEVSEALQLTADQKETVRALADEARKARPIFPRPGRFGPGPTRRTEDDLDRIKGQLWAVLTTDQQARWKELTGEPLAGLAPTQIRKPEFGGTRLH